MFVTFPDSAKIEVSSALANKLLKAAEGLPLYQNEEFYSSTLQLFVMNQIRESSPEEFDALAGLIKSRIAQWPFCVLLQGLRFDEGNRLFVAINRAGWGTFGLLMLLGAAPVYLTFERSRE